MNVRQSVGRLPENIRSLIVTDRAVREHYGRGEELELILGSREWAEEWLRCNAEYGQREVLKAVLERFGSCPFELDSFIKPLGGITRLAGSEVRVAVARLRRSGVLFAVRKSWGDQLLYLPEDNIALWQPLLLPMGGEPLTVEETARVATVSSATALTLSLELLAAWQTLRRQPLTWTGKGTLNRPSVVRLAKELRFDELAIGCLGLEYPQAELVPPQAAFALDLGLYLNVLKRSASDIGVSDTEMERWLAYSPAEADARLYEVLMNRYGKAVPGLQLVASAVKSQMTSEWYRASQLENGGEARSSSEQNVRDWLGLMETFGWLERGDCDGEPVYRKKIVHGPLTDGDLSISEQNREELFVQPDGELLVPPEAPLKLRWVLSDLADPIAADAIFVYRLSRNACNRAFNAGYRLEEVIELLEKASGCPLPEPVARSLADWFAPLGKVAFAEAMLLRAESAEVANEIQGNSEISVMLLEKIGDRDFIVSAESYSLLSAKLKKIGLAPPDRTLKLSSRVQDPEPPEASADEERLESGWIYTPGAVSVYEADRTWPNEMTLFPGKTDIPSSWLTKPRAYHASTRKEMIQRAIAWQALIRLELDGHTRTFVPTGLREEGDRWTVAGSWRPERFESGVMPEEAEPIQLLSEQFTDMMILLPSMEPMETD